MKTIRNIMVIIIMALGTMLVANAQSHLRVPELEHVIVTASFDWADKMPSDSQKNILDDYGLNFHLEAGIQSALSNVIGVEIKVGYEAFPTLYGGYEAYTGAIGIRLVSGRYEEWQYYLGWRTSKVYRTSEKLGKTYRCNMGGEFKITRNITDNVFAGLRATLEKANDQDIFGWEVKTRYGVYAVIGFKIFKL